MSSLPSDPKLGGPTRTSRDRSADMESVEWITDSKTPAMNTATQIVRNKYGQRLDTPLPIPSKDEMSRLKKLKLCNQFMLRGECIVSGKCYHDHNTFLLPGELTTLRYIARTTPCKLESDCNDPKCTYGHVCPQSEEGRSDCYWKGQCWFSRDLHGLDMQPVDSVKKLSSTKNKILGHSFERTRGSDTAQVKQDSAEYPLQSDDHTLCRERREQDRAQFLARNGTLEKQVSENRARLTAQEMEIARKQDRIEELEAQVERSRNKPMNNEKERLLEQKIMELQKQSDVAFKNRLKFSEVYNQLVQHSTAITNTLSEGLRVHTEWIGAARDKSDVNIDARAKSATHLTDDELTRLIDEATALPGNKNISDLTLASSSSSLKALRDPVSSRTLASSRSEPQNIPTAPRTTLPGQFGSWQSHFQRASRSIPPSSPPGQARPRTSNEDHTATRPFAFGEDLSVIQQQFMHEREEARKRKEREDRDAEIRRRIQEKIDSLGTTSVTPGPPSIDNKKHSLDSRRDSGPDTLDYDEPQPKRIRDNDHKRIRDERLPQGDSYRPRYPESSTVRRSGSPKSSLPVQSSYLSNSRSDLANNWQAQNNLRKK